MKYLLVCIISALSFTVIGQESVKLPGESGKTHKIKGTYIGHMIRATGGVDKKKENYYLSSDNGVLNICKHIILLENESTELIAETALPISEIDWDYFHRLYPEGPVEKKVSGKTYWVFSINAQRGKRFKQQKYTKETPAEVTVGNLDIHIADAEEAKSFFNRVKGLR